MSTSGDVRPVTADRFGDLERLFERRGPRGGLPMPGECWCMWWRERSGDGPTNKAAMRRIIEAGAVPGLIAYDQGEPVGWVSIAPREQLGQLLRSRQYGPRDDDSDVWVISCFYVTPRSTGTGVATRLATEAVAYAFRSGAAAIEALPLEKPDFMGAPSMFRALGFVDVRHAGRRTVMRLTRPC